MVLEITVQEVRARLSGGEAVQLLDVREPEERAICALPDDEHIPMLKLFLGAEKPSADPGREIVVYCHTGQRSLEAARFLRRNGFPKALSLAGGIAAWQVTK